MPLWINAANAVLVTSDYEGFGLAAVEALACDVPVLSTPVGIAPYALGGIDGCLCAPFDADRLGAAAAPHLDAADPRVEGAARAASLSAARMAERTIEAYRDVARQPRNRLSRDERGAAAGSESLSAQVEVAKRKLRGGGGRRHRGGAPVAAEIEALEADLERERAEAEAPRGAARRPRGGAAARARGEGAGDRRRRGAPGEIEAQTEAAEKRIEEAEKRAAEAERAIADERARAREGAAAWLREQLDAIRREAERR